MENDRFELTSKPPVVGRIVTATITLVCVLIVYDGWATLKLFDVVLVVVALVVAIFTTHLFSSSLVQRSSSEDGHGGMRGRSLALAVLAGLVVSSIVLLLELALQPGKALKGGIGAPSGA